MWKNPGSEMNNFLKNDLTGAGSEGILNTVSQERIKSVIKTVSQIIYLLEETIPLK